MLRTDPTIWVFLGPDVRPLNLIWKSFFGWQGKFWAEMKSHEPVWTDSFNPHRNLIENIWVRVTSEIESLIGMPLDHAIHSYMIYQAARIEYR